MTIRKGQFSKNAALERLDNACRAAGVPVTLQRRAVYAALISRGDHPTADDLFADISARAETSQMSRTTVYRVLETLVTLGLARRADHLGSSVRYDPYISHHHHLVCVACDRVVDWHAAISDNSSMVTSSLHEPPQAVGSAEQFARREGIPLPDRRQTGFVISDYSIIFRGLCQQCLQKSASTKSASTKSASTKSASTKSASTKSASTKSIATRTARPKTYTTKRSLLRGSATQTQKGK